MEISLDECGNAVSKPFDDVTEVLQWNPGKICEIVTQGPAHDESVGLSEKPSKHKRFRPSEECTGLLGQPSKGKKMRPPQPQLLVCHDMCGGYLEDRFSQGCASMSSYRFYHWQLIDIFVYFSHHLVTIPPCGWIKAAHKHGVSVLGTFITEWEKGVEMCKEVLKSKETIDLFTTKLAQMAKFFGFDGWLINIENKIEADQVPQLQMFVHQLTTKCRSLLDDSKVLWYDSVINTGELKWQDELNTVNEMFFHVCDGIYLNYNITEEKLTRSRVLASDSGRQFDVYTGIDVFGRGTPGGGGFNCREPLKMILDQGLSCAVFAPGWVYEHLGQSQFDSNEVMFWGILSELLMPRSVKVPFATSFCHGYGEKYYMKGQVLSNAPWHNLGLQQVQPTFSESQFVSYTVSKIIEKDNTNTGQESAQDEKKEKFKIEVNTHQHDPAWPKMRFDYSDGYIGGGCLSLTAKRMESLPLLFRIFKISTACQNSVKISVTWKMPADNACPFGVVLSSSGNETESGDWIVCTEDDLSDVYKELLEKMTVQPQDQAVTRVLAPAIQYVTDIQRDQSSPCEYGVWRTSNFTVDLSSLKRKETQNQELILSAVLIPPIQQKENGMDRQMALLLGHLLVHGETDSPLVGKSPGVGNLKCLEVKVTTQLSKENVDEIINNPCFGMEDEHHSDVGITRANQDQLQDTAQNGLNVSSSIQQKRPFSDSNHTVINTYRAVNSISRTVIDFTKKETTVSKLDRPYTLYVLKWDALDENIDHVLVFCHDQAREKHFIGNTVTNCFVHKHYSVDEDIPSFSLQPVMSFTNLPGEETVFTL